MIKKGGVKEHLGMAESIIFVRHVQILLAAVTKQLFQGWGAGGGGRSGECLY